MRYTDSGTSRSASTLRVSSPRTQCRSVKARFTLATDIQVYFCDPQDPWQRGSNENTNGLLSQCFPKGTASIQSQAKLNAVARQLNERPRKTLNYETPAQQFHQLVVSIG